MTDTAAPGRTGTTDSSGLGFSEAPGLDTAPFRTRRERRIAEAAAGFTAETPVTAQRPSPEVTRTVAPGRRESTVSRPRDSARSTLRKPQGPAVVSAPPVSKRRSRRTVLRVFLSVTGMALAAGTVATMAIPAYAFDPAEAVAHGATGERIALASGLQRLSVAADVKSTRLRLDTVSAKQAPAVAAAIAAGGEVIAGSSESGASAYPWSGAATEAQGGGLSPLGYYYRECVDYVAWRLNVAAGTRSSPYKWVWSTLTPLGGEASDWRANWVARGWKVSSKPAVGAVAWWGGIDHVAYVQAVNGDGTITLNEYNWGGNHTFGVRIVSASNPEAYLYYPGS